MKFLKPLFFSKYKPTETYNYPNWTDISFTINNKKMSAFVQEHKGEAKGVVILAHPMQTEGKQYFVRMLHHQLYQQLGYHTIIFDFNGFGDTENRGFDFDIDVYEIILKAKALYPTLPLFIHGVSFGGSQILLGTLKNEELVQGLIVESATSSSLEYYKHRGYNTQFNILNVYKHIDNAWHKNNTYFKSIQQIKSTPILFIYGTKDVITPLWMGEKLYENANAPKHLEVFDTEHLTTISEKKEQYKTTITQFLAEDI